MFKTTTPHFLAQKCTYFAVQTFFIQKAHLYKMNPIEGASTCENYHILRFLAGEFMTNQLQDHTE